MKSEHEFDNSDLAPYDEYRYLHTKLAIKLKLSMTDWLKLARGKIVPRMSFCVRLLLIKDKDGKLLDIDYDMVSTGIVVSGGDDPVQTKEAIFDQDELHNHSPKE